jgi:hypothetical protein
MDPRAVARFALLRIPPHASRDPSGVRYALLPAGKGCLQAEVWAGVHAKHRHRLKLSPDVVGKAVDIDARALLSLVATRLADGLPPF